MLSGGRPRRCRGAHVARVIRFRGAATGRHRAAHVGGPGPSRPRPYAQTMRILRMDPEPVIDRVGSWLEAAACRDRDTDDWFEGDDLGARVVCRSCPVASECLDYAISERLTDGVWGGLRAVDRVEVARLRGIVDEVPEPTRPRRCSCGRTARPSRTMCSGCQQRQYRAGRRR
jgi:WhiB family transcriptional regulator, redox-sensing transcriptional regulator